MRSRFVLWLRVAAIVSFLFAAGHTLGGRKAWSPIGESAVLTAMRTYSFDAEGVNRTYLDFYRGFGFSLSVFMLLQTVVLWQLGTLAVRHAADVRPIVGAFAAASFGITVISWLVIMPVPALFSAALTACIAAAWWSASPGRADQRATRAAAGASTTASA